MFLGPSKVQKDGDEELQGQDNRRAQEGLNESQCWRKGLWIIDASQGMNGRMIEPGVYSKRQYIKIEESRGGGHKEEVAISENGEPRAAIHSI